MTHSTKPPVGAELDGQTRDKCRAVVKDLPPVFRKFVNLHGFAVGTENAPGQGLEEEGLDEVTQTNEEDTPPQHKIDIGGATLVDDVTGGDGTSITGQLAVVRCRYDDGMVQVDCFPCQRSQGIVEVEVGKSKEGHGKEETNDPNVLLEKGRLFGFFGGHACSVAGRVRRPQCTVYI